MVILLLVCVAGYLLTCISIGLIISGIFACVFDLDKEAINDMFFMAMIFYPFTLILLIISIIPYLKDIIDERINNKIEIRHSEREMLRQKVLKEINEHIKNGAKGFYFLP